MTTKSTPAKTRAPRRAQAQINAELAAKAARQAAKTAEAKAEDPVVTCRVLKNGDGKISMGQHAPGIGEVHYEKGEEFAIVKSIADELETRGFVEIQ